jgi:hypothetical protein
LESFRKWKQTQTIPFKEYRSHFVLQI